MPPFHPPSENVTALERVDDLELYEALQNTSVTALAKSLGMSRAALWRRRQNASYRRVVHQMRREVELRLSHQAEADVQLALDTVRTIIRESVSDHARLEAARLLLTIHDNGRAPVEQDDIIASEDRASLLERVKVATTGALRKRAVELVAAADAKVPHEPN
jgi:AcrR family transcriptional regulator